VAGSRVTDQWLLEAAEQTLREHGAARFTAERVAEEAGVSRVTLHRRGWTRSALLAALAAEAEQRYRERMWPILTGPGSGLDRLGAALEVLCVLAEENLSLLLALDAEANAVVFHDHKEQEAMTRNAFTEPLERLLRDGITDGSLREVDPVETATVLFNMVGWTYIHLRSGHHWSARRASEATLEPVLAGLRSS
jgi:AcrR family transcriptional regulator